MRSGASGGWDILVARRKRNHADAGFSQPIGRARARAVGGVRACVRGALLPIDRAAPIDRSVGWDGRGRRREISVAAKG